MKERIEYLRKNYPTIEDVVKASNLTEEELMLANYSGDSIRMIGAKSAFLLFLVTDLFNTNLDGVKWIPDWSNYDEKKWFPIFDLENGCGFSGSLCDGWCAAGLGSRLCFEEKYLSDLSAELYHTTYVKFLTK